MGEARLGSRKKTQALEEEKVEGEIQIESSLRFVDI